MAPVHPGRVLRRRSRSRLWILQSQPHQDRRRRIGRHRNLRGPPNTGSPNARKKRKEKEKTGKECKRFFCVPCKQGGLCVSEFLLEGRPHFEHPSLQIFRTSYENSVRMDDISAFLDTTSVLRICSNDHSVHHLNTRKASTAQTNVMYCEGCREKVANAKSYEYREANARNATVCSIQCLMECRARNRPVNYRNDGHQRKQSTPMQSPLT